MSQGYFSEGAKKLARTNGIRVSDIYTHRDDGLATVDNVKCAILKRHKEGFLVQLKVGITGINPTKTNMELLKKWYKKHAESAKYVVDVSDIKVLIVPRLTDSPKPPKNPPMTIQINYRLHDNRRSEVEYANGFIVDPDDDGNYPIYVKNGKITSINVGVPNGGEAKLVIGRVINSRIVPLNNSNNFGKNFGVGMMGNPIPFKTR